MQNMINTLSAQFKNPKTVFGVGNVKQANAAGVKAGVGYAVIFAIGYKAGDAAWKAYKARRMANTTETTTTATPATPATPETPETPKA